MLAITLGFRSSGADQDCECLYAGPDAAAALEIAESNPAGFVRCEVFKNPTYDRRVYATVAEPVAPAPEPAPAPKKSDKADRSDKSDKADAPGKSLL